MRADAALLALLALFVLSSSLVRRASGEEGKGAREGETPPVCLLTGFEPFGGAPTNASWEAVKGFEGKTISGHRIATARLPVVYDEMERPLLDAIAKHRPRLVVSFGVGTPVVQVETIARNAYHPAKPLDNRRNPPPRDEVVAGGAAEIATALPTAAILDALAKARIGARSSTDAGGYLCNECFYRLMRLGKTGAGAGVVRRGFVHVPPVGAADPLGETFTLEKLREAIRIVVEVTAADADAKPGPSPDKPEAGAEKKEEKPAGRSEG